MFSLVVKNIPVCIVIREEKKKKILWTRAPLPPEADLGFPLFENNRHKPNVSITCQCSHVTLQTVTRIPTAITSLLAKLSW